VRPLASESLSTVLSAARTRWSLRWASPRGRGSWATLVATRTADWSATRPARPRGRSGRFTVERLGDGACWLMVVLKAAGVRLSRAAAGRERSELALDRRMPAAYSVLMSQHAPRPDAPVVRMHPPPILTPPPVACRPIPDDGRRTAGGWTRVTGSGAGIVALPAPVPVPGPAARRPHPEPRISTDP